jgi:hypothetical protein
MVVADHRGVVSKILEGQWSRRPPEPKYTLCSHSRARAKKPTEFQPLRGLRTEN